MNPLLRRALIVVWPAFLMAAVLEMVVFALVDPGSLHWFGGAPVELSATAVYSIAFFVFWAVIVVAGVISQLLSMPAEDVNAPGGGVNSSSR